MGIILPIILLISSYLLGSIPWALIMSKLVKGIDIREHGSKNMGATNTVRVLGTKYGIIVFILDALKAGFVISLFTLGLLDHNVDWMVLKIHPLIYGFVALIGHIFPVFAKFKGGKGVACCAGILLAYEPLIFIFTMTVFTLVFIWKKYISLASILAAIATLIISFIPFGGEMDWFFTIIVVCAVTFLIIRHIPNIKRLINHTENKTKLSFKDANKK